MRAWWQRTAHTLTAHQGATAEDHALILALLMLAPALLTAAAIAYALFAASGSGLM